MNGNAQIRNVYIDFKGNTYRVPVQNSGDDCTLAVFSGYGPDKDLDRELYSAIPEEDEEDARTDRTRELRVIRKVSAAGTGLCVYITREVRSLGLDRGDLVEITIRKP